MSLQVRPAEERDIAAMAVLRAHEWETEAFWRSSIRRYLSGQHSPRQALPARVAFVAEDKGVVVGFVSGHRTKRYGCSGELQWVNVSPARRGRGIAGRLLEEMAAWFVEQHALRVCVDVDPRNIAARALYSKYGAQPLNEHWMVWKDVGSIITGDARGTNK